MMIRVFTILALACLTAEAQVYRCPAQDAGTDLTNAEIRIGPRNGAHALHGDVDQVEGGTNIHFDLAGEAPRWLVCQYGGKQIGGTALSGPRSIGSRESWIQLEPMITACDLVIREAKSRASGQKAWSAAAACKRDEPPPPDLVSTMPMESGWTIPRTLKTFTS